MKTKKELKNEYKELKFKWSILNKTHPELKNFCGKQHRFGSHLEPDKNGIEVWKLSECC
jgi:hypothetical protein